MLEVFLLLLGAFRTVLCSRAGLIAENLLLRQQLAVLARPTRKRPQLRARDKLLWVLALDRLADLTEEASRLADSPGQAATLLRLRVRYRPEAELI